MKNIVDIIVPVYNAYEYTEECIKSLIKNTDLTKNRVILINDKSPDQKILPMLKKYSEQNNNIIVLDNEVNLGFVGTVNKGMKYSNNDVVLLNSDTEVTANWLEKMETCAYSNEYIATVTPFTNNGTLCSIPNFGIDNELPKNMSLDAYAELVEKCSKKEYPQLSTANGFCMYIKRKVIDEIGYFDEETFEKGYGEENDFSYRALNYGYTNNLCDDTFIYHKGSQSFTNENLTTTRAQVIKEHMRRLAEKHPQYVAKNDNFIITNPNSKIQEKIRLNIELYNKKRILFLVNEWEEDMNMTGGTSLHIKDIINGIRQNSACFVLSPDKNDLTRMKLFLYTENFGKQLYNFRTQIFNYNQMPYTNQSYKNLVRAIFDTYKIDLLHVHHFLYQTFDAIDIAKEKNVYSILTLHDLYMLCPSINMVKDGKYCNGAEIEKCKQCYKQKFNMDYNTLDNWRNTCKNVIKKFDEVIVPSENTKKLFKEVYPEIDYQVIPHGVEIKIVDNVIDENKQTFDIAFVGVMAEHKGVNILKALVDKFENTNVRVHLIGKLPKNYEKMLNGKNNFINHGAYERGTLAEKIKEYKIDLVTIFAIWPETYSYTLTEVYMSKTPLLVYNIGAVGDRVSNDSLGWVMDINSNIDEIEKKINEIKQNKEEYKKIKSNFENYQYKSLEQMQKEYEEKYLLNELKNGVIDLEEMEKFDIGTIREELTRYQFLINRYEKIRNSKPWKLAKKIKSKIRRR